MHPTLDNPQLIECQDIINALNQCHQESQWRKYLGVCNHLKTELNQCLTADVCTIQLGDSTWFTFYFNGTNTIPETVFFCS
jgi:hypothetical protein